MHFLVHTLPFSNAHFDLTTAQIAINCTLKYALRYTINQFQSINLFPANNSWTIMAYVIRHSYSGRA